jgi:hypothetical protein
VASWWGVVEVGVVKVVKVGVVEVGVVKVVKVGVVEVGVVKDKCMERSW